MPQIKNFFPGGNTPEGFYSFYRYLPFEVDRIYIIKGGPGTGKSTFIKKIGLEANTTGYNIEFHWCSSDNDSLDGLVIPELNFAILDGTAPHIIDPVNPGAIDEIINLGIYWDSDRLQTNKENIISLNNIIKYRFKKVYHYLKAARIVYQQWRSYYQEGLNTEKYKNTILKVIKEIVVEKKIKKGKERHLFGSAITPGGPVNYLENITGKIKRRYMIKGNPGTGKADLIDTVCREIARYGYFILYLHCPLFPKKLDAAIIPELDTALVVAAPPHYLEATDPEDKIINLTHCLDLDYIKKYNGEIIDTEKIYEDLIKRVYYYLKDAKKNHDKLEEYYVEAMNFNGVEEKRKELMGKILPEKQDNIL
ncbi:MAG: PRK06851 family protein [Halanaerobiaceae bacterium]